MVKSLKGHDKKAHHEGHIHYYANAKENIRKEMVNDCTSTSTQTFLHNPDSPRSPFFPWSVVKVIILSMIMITMMIMLNPAGHTIKRAAFAKTMSAFQWSNVATHLNFIITHLFMIISKLDCAFRRQFKLVDEIQTDNQN